MEMKMARQICIALLVVGVAGMAAAAETVTVTNRSASVRSGPGAEHELLVTAQEGDVFTYLGFRSDGWVSVDVPGYAEPGWIHENLVEVRLRDVSEDDDSEDEGVAAVMVGMQTLLALVVALYFMPGLVAYRRNHHQAGAIWVLDIFLGWTALGWIVAFAMAMSAVDATRAPEKPAIPMWVIPILALAGLVVVAGILGAVMASFGDFEALL